MFKNALVSVYDKTHLLKFINPLVKQGMRVVSTGKTAELLKSAGLSVCEVSEQTNFPELMEGRVKTLHPKIYLPLLARADNTEDKNVLKTYNLEPFDLLICNLYPFEDKQTTANIDVGGPSMLRAGAKNCKQVTVLCDPADYEVFLKPGPAPDLETRQYLAGKAFSYLARYNLSIAKWLIPKQPWHEKKNFYVTGSVFKNLSYGENPSQKALWFKTKKGEGLHKARVLQGKELSFNNICDLESACSTLRLFNEEPSAVFVKHNNPCGFSTGKTLPEALLKALKSDPVSAFGGVSAVNQTLCEKSAETLSSLFLSALIAPAYTEPALKILSRKKKLIVLEWPDICEALKPGLNLRTVEGGFIVQEDLKESVLKWQNHWNFLSNKKPSEQEKSDLLTAWRVCSRLKSNAISLVYKGQTVGLGMGQVSRIQAVELALRNWKKFHPHVAEPVLASDGFFPFPDSVAEAGKAGVRWIIQPGGSIRDLEVAKEAKKLAVNMVLTGERCFLH